jgi:glutathione S-transferase
LNSLRRSRRVAMFYSLENCGSATVRLANMNRAGVQSAALAESGSSMDSDYAFIKSKRGVADGYLFTVLRWTDIHKIDLSGYPNISGFMKRMASRPAVQEAMKAEGLLK